GEPLYAVSRRYGISVNDLAAANDITNPSAVYAGQKLVIPGAGAKKAATQVASLGSSAVRSDTKPLATKSRDKEVSYKGAYKVSKGDTLSAVAARHGVRVSDLKAANGIGEGDVIKIGQTLSVPSAANTTQIASVDRVKTAAVPKAATPKQRIAAKSVESVSKRVSLAPAVPSAAVSKPEAITQTDVASVNPSAGLPRLDGGEAASKAAPAKPYTTPKLAADKAVKQAKKPVTASGASFKWPVRGEMISGFGRSSDGTTNDGINIKVPAGTPVRATAAGEVIYAADGLAGYGKLVLIRHSNGFVSAYGHNSDLKVRRGDRVRQGQVVASSGDTGSVNSPQVHFELREGKRPVDPLAHLAS
ncbi:MAG: peptidoglycan DD-metalloendopeptidase family protein, partial [Pseudomonadota bacterium]